MADHGSLITFPLFTIVFISITACTTNVTSARITSISKADQMPECTMCDACENPCQPVPTLPPPSPPPPVIRPPPPAVVVVPCPPPPAALPPPATPACETGCYTPPVQQGPGGGGGGYAGGGGGYNPNVPAPPNPIVPYFPYYYYPPPGKPSKSDSTILMAFQPAALASFVSCFAFLCFFTL